MARDASRLTVSRSGKDYHRPKDPSAPSKRDSAKVFPMAGFRRAGLSYAGIPEEENAS